MTKNAKKDILGVVGGMGPLASAEFLKTVYEYNLGEREQESPVVIVYSDPTVPDRTEEFLANSYGMLSKRLTEMLCCLDELGASKFVICCITIHCLLPRLSDDLRERIISLPDVIFASVLRSRKRHLLICTNGTRKMAIFQSHRLWELSKDYIVLPDDNDQQMIHDFIYQGIKKRGDIRAFIPFLESLLSKYKVDSFISGCTELHLLAKYLASNGNREGYGCIDPLTIVAKEISTLSHCLTRESATHH